MFTLRVYTYNNEPLVDYLQLQSRSFLLKTIFDIKEVEGVDLLKVPLSSFNIKFASFPLEKRLSYIVFDVIDSDLIKRCPHFDKGPRVDIFVPPLYLTQFVKITRVTVSNHLCACCPDFIKRFLNRNFKSVRDRLKFVFHLDIDCTKFPEHWKGAGYPLFLGGEPEDPERISHWLVLSHADMDKGVKLLTPETRFIKAPSLLALLNRLYLHDKTFNLFNEITGVTTDGATFDMLLNSLQEKIQKEFRVSADEAESVLKPVANFVAHSSK